MYIHNTVESRAVVGALNETEDANGLLQDEIKQLLAEQDEQEELRNELVEILKSQIPIQLTGLMIKLTFENFCQHDQLRERSELMQMMARQTVSDSNASTNILDV